MSIPNSVIPSESTLLQPESTISDQSYIANCSLSQQLMDCIDNLTSNCSNYIKFPLTTPEITSLYFNFNSISFEKTRVLTISEQLENDYNIDSLIMPSLLVSLFDNVIHEIQFSTQLSGSDSSSNADLKFDRQYIIIFQNWLIEFWLERIIKNGR